MPNAPSVRNDEGRRAGGPRFRHVYLPGPSLSLRSRGGRLRGRGQVVQRVYARAHLVGQPLYLVGLEVGGAEGVHYLLLAELREQVAYPLRVLHLYVVEEAGVLAVVVEAHAVALDLLDEAGLDVLFGLVAAVREGAASLAEGRA